MNPWEATLWPPAKAGVYRVFVGWNITSWIVVMLTDAEDEIQIE